MGGRIRRFGADRLGAGHLATLKGTVYLFGELFLVFAFIAGTVLYERDAWFWWLRRQLPLVRRTSF
jgi:hypothetical protein